MDETDGIEMTRGGRAKSRGEPERRCIATGESGPRQRLVRFVLGPDGDVVPDLQGKLPGRGAWLTADRALIARALKKSAFSRAFRQPVRVEVDLADVLEALIARRMVDLLGLARKAGAAVTGFEKTRARLAAGGAGVLFTAADAAADGREKMLRALPEGTAHLEALTSGELGLAFGRDFAIHAALDAGGLADRILIEAERLTGLRSHSGD